MKKEFSYCLRSKSVIMLILALIINLSLTRITSSQNFHTIRVNGKIVLENKGIELDQGVLFSENDSLVFYNYNASAFVIHPERGRFVIRPDNNDLAYARANFTPSMSNISSRNIDIDVVDYSNIDVSKARASFIPAISNVSSRSSNIANLNDMQNHFHGDYAIIDDIKLFVNPDEFPMTDKKFFFIRYELNYEPVIKKLSFSNDTLKIYKEELFAINDTENIDKMEVWYIEQDYQNKITYIGEFNPIFPDNEILFNELAIIINVFKNKSKEELLAEILSYINESYGKPNRKSVESWINKTFDFQDGTTF